MSSALDSELRNEEETPEERPQKRQATGNAVKLGAEVKPLLGDEGATVDSDIEEGCPGSFECPICLELMVEPTVGKHTKIV